MTPLDLGDLRSDIAFQHENNRDIVVSSRRLRVLVPKSDEQGLEWKLTIMPDKEGKDSETLLMKHSAHTQLLSLLNFRVDAFDGITTQGTQIERKAVDLFLNTLLGERNFDLSLSIIAREWDDPIVANIAAPDDKVISNYDLIENIVPMLNVLQRVHDQDIEVMETELDDEGTLRMHVLNKSVQYKIGDVPHHLGVTIIKGIIYLSPLS